VIRLQAIDRVLRVGFCIVASTLLTTAVAAQQPPSGHGSGSGSGGAASTSVPGNYAGQQTRTATSLSDDEVAGLPAGKGLGLAKPAELNGYPGPMHTLELADQLALTADQRAALQLIFDRMAARAKVAGAAYVEAEQALDGLFRSGKADTKTVMAALAKADKARAAARMAHLKAHIETTPILTPQQRATYAQLRGYAAN
jgi:Spy/CpxP family protein refolding chaperone